VNQKVEPAEPQGRPADRGALDSTAHLGPSEPGPVPAKEFDTPPGGMTLEDARAVDALPPTSALLIVQHGPNVGARFLLDAPRVTAGRSPDADIFLDDVTVSRKHADFVGEGGDYAVRDVGSLNGTYLNRTRIDETSPLREGDEVQIGKYRLTYHPSPNRPAPGAGAGGS
jgi:pSer/pThr/pTyr-binding forkhead associated (FHA) protein